MKNRTLYPRFNRMFIVQHIILLVSVLLLILSGVPLKFPDSAISQFLVSLQGGMEMRAAIHRYSGWLLMLLGAFHFLHYIFFDRGPAGRKWQMLVEGRDFLNILGHLGYIFRLRKSMPRMGRYTWWEKLEYFGLIWGLAVMGATGFVMLYMDLALRVIPLSWFQALWAAHSTEAMEATLFLLIIHMYHVHFSPEKFPMSLTWLHGRISHEEMERYHSLELESFMVEEAETESEEEQQTPPLNKLQEALDRINSKFGAAGAIVGVIFWIAVLVMVLIALVADI